MKLIDFHSHYMPPTVGENTMFFKMGWSDIDRQLSTMDEHGIDKAVLLYPTSDAHIQMGGWANVCEPYNTEIARVVSEHPHRLIGGGILPMDAPDLFPAELNRIRDLGLKVISLASSYDGIYLDDERFACIFEFAREHNLPVHIHSQIINPIGEDRVKDPLLSPVLEYVMDVSMCLGKMMMEGIFTKYPEVNFVFAHYGGVLPIVKERFDNTYQMLRKRDFVKDLGKLPGEFFKNLYFDTSGSKSPASLLAALEMTDPQHILYGSDFPANQNIPSSLTVLDEVNLDETAKKALFSNFLVEECV